MGSRAPWAGLVAAACVALGLGACGGGALVALAPVRVVSAVERSEGTLRACPSAVRRLGLIAVAATGGLDLLDLASCRRTTLHAGAATDVRFSPDGRWLGYSRLVNSTSTGSSVVSVRGGPARSPLGTGILAWSWARAGETLYGITGDGSLISASPTGNRRVVGAGLGPLSPGTGFGLSPDGGRVAVDTSRCERPVGELETVDVKTGARSVVVREPDRFFTFAGWSPDGRWLLYWSATQCSASLAADGWPLEAVPATGGKPVRVVRHMLLFSDFLSWCGTRLIAAAGPDRETQLGSALVETQPPAWRDQTLENAGKLSWVSPACAPSGRLLAAAAGQNTQDPGFGVEHRSIWLLRTRRGPARRLTSPPARELSDEAPRFSHDSRWILLVRARVVPVGDSAISRDTIELTRASGAGTLIPIIDFTSDDFSFYDHFDWPDEIDWYQAR